MSDSSRNGASLLPCPLGVCVCVFQGISLDRDSRFLSREGFQSSRIEGDFGRSAVREYGIGMSIFTPFGTGRCSQLGTAKPGIHPRLYSLCHSGFGLWSWRSCSSSPGLRAGIALGMGRIFQHQKSQGENPWGAE